MAEISTNEIPIRWGKYVNHEMEEQKVVFVGSEKAIYDKNGKQLDVKLSEIEEGLSDAFSETKSYASGDYCIYLNRLYKFIAAKPAGPWDGSAVIPITLSQEIQQHTQLIHDNAFSITANTNAIEGINGALTFQLWNGDWDEVPTGIFYVSSKQPNSPEGEDGYNYVVFCKNKTFQVAYRVALRMSTSRMYERYAQGGIWNDWYRACVTGDDLADCLIRCGSETSSITDRIVSYWNNWKAGAPCAGYFFAVDSANDLPEGFTSGMVSFWIEKPQTALVEIMIMRGGKMKTGYVDAVAGSIYWS